MKVNNDYLGKVKDRWTMNHLQRYVLCQQAVRFGDGCIVLKVFEMLHLTQMCSILLISDTFSVYY